VRRTVIDVVVETMGMGGFLHDAAAKVGVSVETLRRWRQEGSKGLYEITEGTRRRSEMSRHVKLCMVLTARMDRAETDARMKLLGIADGLASGGLTRTEVTVKTITPTVDKVAVADPVEVERVTRTIEEAPDGRMVQWLLAHRWPADFGSTRVEVTGADGGPIVIDATPAIDKITQHLDAIRAARAETDPARLTAALAGNGEGGNGHHP